MYIYFSLLKFDDDDVKIAQQQEVDLFDNSNNAFVEEDGPSTEPELISMDPPRSLIEERDDIRPDSPLGILDISLNDDEASSSSFTHLVGPLPPLPNLANQQPVPKIQPPNGWINKVTKTGDFQQVISSIKQM